MFKRRRNRIRHLTRPEPTPVPIRWNLVTSPRPGVRMTLDTFGPYQLGELVGRGGMGEVHRAYDTRRERAVALKRLRPEFVTDDRFRARFLQECQRAARLTEPHVIPIHDFGEVDGRLYLDMRLIEGSNLAQVIKATGPLPTSQAIEVVTQVAAALDAAHAADLIHRDVKPSNVLLDSRGTAVHSYLVDFGVAGAIGASTSGLSLTATGALMGTVAYIAPERLRGRPADHRVDVYSLACLLHEVVTGQPPFQQPELLAMINAHLNLAPPRASELAASVPARLDTVIARGMAKDPNDRYSNAGELAAAARAAVCGDRNRVPGAGSRSTAQVGGGPYAGSRANPAGTSGGPPGKAATPVMRAPAAYVAATARPTTPGKGAAAQRRRPRWAPRSLVFTLLLLASVTAVAVSYLAAPPVYREAATAAGARPPFIPPTASPAPPPLSPAPAIGNVAVTGDTPGLYGGTRSNTCNAQAIGTFLKTRPVTAAAWTSALGLRPDQVEPFLGSLTPLTLRTDTAVTNHGFTDGRATPFQAVLQAGTAVLVDAEGLPRVRCYCGNPLGEPDERSWKRYAGTEWAGFSGESVRVITKARGEIRDFVVVALDTKEVVNRPRGTRGDQDRPADRNVAKQVEDHDARVESASGGTASEASVNSTSPTPSPVTDSPGASSSVPDPSSSPAPTSSSGPGATQGPGWSPGPDPSPEPPPSEAPVPEPPTPTQTSASDLDPNAVPAASTG
jgi:hypothetical protein